MQVEQLRDQLVYGINSKELRTKLLSAAYGQELGWAKVMDTVNNFEYTSTSLKRFQQAPLRTDSMRASYKANTGARGTAPHDRKKGARETACYRCLGEDGHQAASCKYKEFQCRACNQKGNLERACKSKTTATEATDQGGRQTGS